MLDHYSRLTNRLVKYIESLGKVLPISHISKLVDLHWETIKNIDKCRLNRDIKPLDPLNVTKLVMDEFAIRKGHRYATVIADARTMKMLWVGEGNNRKSIRPFFEELGEYRDNIILLAITTLDGIESIFKVLIYNGSRNFDCVCNYHFFSVTGTTLFDSLTWLFSSFSDCLLHPTMRIQHATTDTKTVLFIIKSPSLHL